MRRVVTVGLALSLAFDAGNIEGLTAPVNVEASVNNEITLIYTDFDTDADWAHSMTWMVSKGLIGGTPRLNKKTGKTEQWLLPRNTLTEAQFVGILYRYFQPNELRNLKPAVPSQWSSTAYQLAAKDKLPTLGSIANFSLAGKFITRGKMAQLLASKHFGRTVTEKEAVQFMYDAGLSSGYSVNGKSPKTFTSFGTKDKLQRAHIASFFMRYDANIGKGGAVKPPTTTTGTDQTIGNIKVQYGSHAYGSNNQTEYNAVMKIAKDAVANFKWDTAHRSYVDAYLKGERFDGNRNNRDPKNMALYSYETKYGSLIKAGASNDMILKLIEAETISASLLQGLADPLDGSPRSAYDALVRKVADCDPQAHVRTLIFDIYGFNTLVATGKAHAEPYVKVGNTWLEPKAGGFTSQTKTEIMKDRTITTQPKAGTF